MGQLSLLLFGTFQAHLDGAPIPGFESDKARALLAYLAVEVDQPHRRDRLAGLLWPDWPEANARTNLRHALNNLSKVLRNPQAIPPFLLSDRQTIQFNPDSDYHLDVTEFSRHLGTLAEVEAGRANERAVQGLQQAVKAYRGPFLSGFFLDGCSEFEEWTLLTRERLQNQMLAALGVLARHFERQGEYEAAQHYARSQIEIDALREEAHRHLMRLQALADQRSAALVQFETCRQLLADELGVEPSAETIELHRQIQSGLLKPQPDRVTAPPPVALPPRVSAPRHNLPAQTTRFIGRAVQLAAVHANLLDPEVRLLTLTGPGGTGKTRLALQVAADLLDCFADGVFFVSFAPLRDPELVSPTIAEVLGVRETGNRPVLDLLKEYIQDKHMLLLLDNFEHLFSAAMVVSDLLAAAPRLKILVTSRVLLQLYGEHRYSIPPLLLPTPTVTQSLDSLLENEACQLFIDRARTIKPDFVVTGENAGTVAEICARVDGLPLAIELAAARSKFLPLQKMLAQLTSRLQLLTRGARNLPVRHQALRNTIEWSYELLEVEEQILFRRLAVFTGSWTSEAAEAVGNITGGVDVLNGLESLVDKSLINQVEAAGEFRFMMLETIREYGLERLSVEVEAMLIQKTYANYYLEVAEALAQALQEGDQETCLEQMGREYDNVRAALQWAQDHQEVEMSLRLVGALWRFWQIRGYITEGHRYLEAALVGSEGATSALRAEAYTGAGTMAYWQGDYQGATIHHQAALALYRELGDEEGVAFALNNLGVQVNEMGDHEWAMKFFEESLTLSRRLDENHKLNDKLIMIAAIHGLGEVARLHQGNYERALPAYEEALAWGRQQGNKWFIARELTSVGMVRRHLGNYRQAAADFKEGLFLSRELNNKECIAACFEGFAGLALTQSQPERAVRLLGAAEILRETIGAPIPGSERDDYDQNIALAYDTIGEAALAAAWAAGRLMTLEQAIAYALQETDHNE